MPNTSASGGYLVPDPPPPPYDAELDAIFAGFIKGLTGLPGTLVRPRWQVVVPDQPEPTVNWCGVGVMNVTKDPYPVIQEVPNLTNDGYVGLYTRHEAIDVLASFYGPKAQGYAALAEDGMLVGQNNDMLKPFQMAVTRAAETRSVPELVNLTWVKRFDVAFSVKRKVIRTQQILTILSAEIDIIADCPPVITEVVQVVPAP